MQILKSFKDKYTFSGFLHLASYICTAIINIVLLKNCLETQNLHCTRCTRYCICNSPTNYKSVNSRWQILFHRYHTDYLRLMLQIFQSDNKKQQIFFLF